MEGQPYLMLYDDGDHCLYFPCRMNRVDKFFSWTMV